MPVKEATARIKINKLLKAVLRTLLTRGIRPESLAPVEDVKKLERRLSTSDKQAQKKPGSLT